MKTSALLLLLRSAINAGILLLNASGSGLAASSKLTEQPFPPLARGEAVAVAVMDDSTSSDMLPKHGITLTTEVEVKALADLFVALDARGRFAYGLICEIAEPAASLTCTLPVFEQRPPPSTRCSRHDFDGNGSGRRGISYKAHVFSIPARGMAR